MAGVGKGEGIKAFYGLFLATSVLVYMSECAVIKSWLMLVFCNTDYF